MRIILVVFCVFTMLAACNTTDSVSQTDKTDTPTNEYGNHLVREITLDNYWKYFSTGGYSAITNDSEFSYHSGIRQSKYQSINYSLTPLLTCCIYEDVVFVFTCKVWDVNDESIIYTTEMTLKLPANGNGAISVSYSSVPEGLTPSFPYSDISRCKRALIIKSISGSIIF